MAYLGIFINGTRIVENQKLGIGVSEWSALYNLPIFPVGIDYTIDDEGNNIVRMVFGREMPALKDLQETDGVIDFSLHNKYEMKKFCYDILVQTFRYFGRDIPEHYKTDLRNAHLEYTST